MSRRCLLEAPILIAECVACSSAQNESYVSCRDSAAKTYVVRHSDYRSKMNTKVAAIRTIMGISTANHRNGSVAEITMLVEFIVYRNPPLNQRIWMRFP